MSWTRLDHNCAMPSVSQIESAGAMVGSIWRCQLEGCHRGWRLVEFRRAGGTYHWERVDYGVPTGERTNSCAVTR